VVGLGQNHKFREKPIPDGFASVTVNKIYKNKGAFVVNKLLGKQMKKDSPSVKLASLASHVTLWPVACLAHNAAAEKSKPPSTVDDMWD